VEEYKKALGDKEKLEYDDLKGLVLAAAVIKETLRLIPVTHTVPKISEEDVEVGGYVIPKQTLIVIDLPNLHKHPSYWKEPTKFNPERFLTDEIIPGSYLPFSMGSRGCIGMKFAEAEAAIALSIILNKFKVTIPEGFEEPKYENCRQEITTVPNTPVKIILSPR